MNTVHAPRLASGRGVLGNAGLALAAALGLQAGLPSAATAQQDQTWFNLADYVDAGNHWGSSVAFLPDVNADGYPELLVGGPGYGDDGAVRVVSGKPPHTVLKWHFPDLDFDPNRAYGQLVANAGDVNGDQIADYAISAPGENVPSVFSTLIDAGEVRIYSGKTFTQIRSFNGFLSGAYFGEALALNADVTGDGRPDILIGAPHYGPSLPDSGYIQLYNGATGLLIHTINADKAGDLLGLSVAFVGDLTGDGRSEYAFSLPGYDSSSSGSNVGRVFVFNGATNTTVYGKTGSFSGGDFGAALCGVGDTDGDGLRELLVGAPGVQGKGAAYLYEGSSGTLVRTYNGVLAGERFGSWLCNAGDLDKDGFKEIAIGGTESGVPSGGGVIRVFDGGDGTLYKTHDFFTGSGVSQSGSFDGGQDFNRDGWPDLAVGYPNSDQVSANGGGAVVLGQLAIQGDAGFAGPQNLQFSVQGGQLKSGSKADLLLTGGPNGGLPFLVMSTSVGFTPLFGGTLLPNLTNAVVVNFPPMNGGVLFQPGINGGNGPVNFYAQFVVFGFPGANPIGISNALILQFLP
jgi:FG-GAP repeat